jgi:signal transduction histidine kinase
VSHGIVEAHGGSIEVESVVGEGTTFHVYLPLEPALGEQSAQERSAA